MLLGTSLLASLLVSCSMAAPAAQPKLSYDNIDKAATPRAKELLKFIQSQYGTNFISGQQEASSVAWLQQNIGVTPAIQGSDLMYYSSTPVSQGSKSNTTEVALQFAQQGGINALVWHWFAPSCLLETDEEPWYKGFYTEGTCFDIEKAVADESNKDFDMLIKDIDAIAAQFKRLSEADVPVLFRPLHEPEGGWFWWGAKGPAPFKKLWDILYDRITRVHDIHNIVWVCNTGDPNWYPGNDKCDIATIDYYGTAGDHGPLADKFQSLQNVTQNQRVLALAEVGSAPDPKLQASQNAPWAYWMTWNDEFITNATHNSPEFLKDTYENINVLAIGDVKGFDNTSAGNGTTPAGPTGTGNGTSCTAPVGNGTAGNNSTGNETAGYW